MNTSTAEGISSKVSTSVTVYPWWDQVPEHLTTKTQLAREGLKPPKGARPSAGIGYGQGRRERYYDLYDRREAVAKRKPTEAQLGALEKAHLVLRTCRRCGAVKDKPSCLITSSDIWYSKQDIYTGLGCCWACEAKAEEAVHALDRDEQILWARALLARTDWCILDTETADLYGALLEVAVIAPDESRLYHSLVRPADLATMTIDDEGRRAVECDEFRATHVHGIRPSDVATAPLFADIEAPLRTAITGRTVVVYNVSYDLGVLESEISLLVSRKENGGWDLAGQQKRASEWLGAAAGWECAMIPYSAFAGAWSDYHQDYTYQPLDGGHRAEGDCRAVLGRIKYMAAAALINEEKLES